MFVRTEAQKLPELWPSLSTLTDTPYHVIVGNHLIAQLAEHLDEALIVDNFPIFVKFEVLAIESDAPQGISADYLMLGVIISFLPASHVGDLRDIILEMRTVFQTQLTVTSQKLLATCLLFTG
jgi:hypothetical protein